MEFNTERIKLTFLGTGTSQGVPVIACTCPVCQSDDEKDKRLRVSVLIEVNGKNLVIDSGPDFRQQMLREKVDALDAILFTHEHKDHISGMDDIRAYNFRSKRPMDVYASEAVQRALQREYYYIFEPDPYPGVPRVKLHTISTEPFEIDGIPIVPVKVMHYQMPVLGFRVGDLAYITDAKTISSEEKTKLKGVKVLVLNALRKAPHISHLNLDEALQLIDELKPERAYLTHISHLMGKHNLVSEELPDGVEIAYDGLKVLV
jgi:phosphoribosyl 1,2-cyclic phosphate phosphodiesterase